MNSRKFSLIAILSAITFSPLQATAFSLGEITVRSYLGQPLLATIPLHTKTDEEVDIACMSLAPKPEMEGITYLRHAKFSLSKQGDTVQLDISGENILNEPYLIVRVQAGCQEGGNLTREYTVLIDPAVYTSAQPPLVEKPGLATNSSGEASPIEASHQAQQALADESGLPVKMTKRATASHPHAVKREIKQAKPAISQKKIDRSIRVPVEPRLKVVSGVGEAPTPRADQANEKNLQQQEMELNRELDDKTAQFLAMQAKLDKLEAKLAEMKQTMALQNRVMDSLQKIPAPVQESTNSWKNYWPVGPAILILGALFFFFQRSRNRFQEHWDILSHNPKFRKVKLPF